MTVSVLMMSIIMEMTGIVTVIMTMRMRVRIIILMMIRRMDIIITKAFSCQNTE